MGSKNRSARSRAAAATRRRTQRTKRQYDEALAAATATASHVTQVPTRVVNEVARPKITLIEFADAIQLNINSQRYKTYALADGIEIRLLLTAIAERTGAIDVANINLDHLDS